MLFAELNLSVEPTWPWSVPNIGPPTMLSVALLIVGLTVWTYLGVQRATWRLVLLVLAFRLAALVLAFLMVIRPSFGVTHLEGVEPSTWLVLFDVSGSMNTADVPSKPTRWEQVKSVWASRRVQRRLEQLEAEQKVKVVKYLAAEELRSDEPDATPTGKRTDIGVWLHQLIQKHGHEKRIRGVAIFSDGGNNGTRYAVLDKARQWKARGICPIHTFGAGKPDDTRKGIALTHVHVDPSPVSVKSKMNIKVTVQVFGFDELGLHVTATLEDPAGKNVRKLADIAALPLKLDRKDGKTRSQGINLPPADAPAEAGEYKLTLKITALGAEGARQEKELSSEISTFVQVIEDKIHVLWVDRPRVYEPTFALRFALLPEARFKVHYREPGAGEKRDPIAWYGLEQQHYHVIVIGDLSARQFSFEDDRVFAKLKELVETKKTGLLMLGGTETFARGGWKGDEKKPNPIMDLLPVDFAASSTDTVEVRPLPTTDGLKYPFLQLRPDAKENAKLWNDGFEELEIAPIGGLVGNSMPLLKSEKHLVMAERRSGTGNVVVFAGYSTSVGWFETEENIRAYQRFWKQLIYWLAQRQDAANPLWITLDQRRINAGAAEALGFAFGLRSKTGIELPRAKFTSMKVVGPSGKEYSVSVSQDQDQHQHRGVFQEAKERGEHQLILEGNAKDAEGNDVQGRNTARFVVDDEDVETLRPIVDHDLLEKIASATDGRFFLAEEEPLLQYLDSLQQQVNREGHLKTTHWPDWKRVPASDHLRDQLAGLWNSFALGSFVLFVALLGGEWFLRRWWGLV